MVRVIITGLAAAILSGGIGYALIPMLRALKAGQSIREVGPTWHNSKKGTPMMGGLMFVFATLLCLLFSIPAMTDYSVFYVMGLGMCFGLVGFLDDFFKLKFKRNLGLTALQKALLQMAVSALFVYFLYRQGILTCDVYVPFFDTTFYMHPIAYVVFAMFIMVGGVNSVNLTDGVDGLCASVTVPVMVFFTAVAVALKKWDLALLPACLTGALLAYLVYNWHPAKVFMGDTGSLFLGGIVTGLAFAVDMPLILILVGIVYICETLSVILQVAVFKATKGKRLFKMSPIHHHFEMCGWKEVKIVLVFTSVSLAMCVLAWFGVMDRIG